MERPDYSGYDELTAQLQVAYDSWLSDMNTRDDAQFTSVEFDPEKHPEQAIDIAKIPAVDAHPDMPDWLYYAGFDMVMIKALGFRDYWQMLMQMDDQFVSATDNTRLIDRLVTNQTGDADGNKRNTLVVTSHFTFPEFGYFKALRFRLKRDRTRMAMGGALLNKLMTRQKYDGKKIVDHFRPMNVYFSYPVSESSARHNVPEAAVTQGNRKLLLKLMRDIKSGGLEMDAALTGKQIIAHKNPAGEVDYYEIPKLHKTSAELIGHFDDILGATMIRSPKTGRWQMRISDLMSVGEMSQSMDTSEIADLVYEQIADSVAEITEKDVQYNPLTKELGATTLSIAGA